MTMETLIIKRGLGYIVQRSFSWLITLNRNQNQAFEKNISSVTFWAGPAIMLWCSGRFVKLNKRSIRTFLAAFSNVTDIIRVKSSCKRVRHWSLILTASILARLCCCFSFHESEASIVYELHSGRQQKPQSFQHHKNGSQEIVVCNA